MKKPFLFLLSVCAFCATGIARETLSLNDGWKFRYGWNFAGPKWAPVTLPHTWNTADAEADHPYTRTLGIYRTDLAVPSEWKGKRVFLRFKGAATVADVMVNDRWLGQHRGGYTAFCYEITDLLTPGKKVPMRVRVSNAETTDVLPLAGVEILHRAGDIMIGTAELFGQGLDESGGEAFFLLFAPALQHFYADMRHKVHTPFILYSLLQEK